MSLNCDPYSDSLGLTTVTVGSDHSQLLHFNLVSWPGLAAGIHLATSNPLKLTHPRAKPLNHPDRPCQLQHHPPIHRPTCPGRTLAEIGREDISLAALLLTARLPILSKPSFLPFCYACRLPTGGVVAMGWLRKNNLELYGTQTGPRTSRTKQRE